MTSGGFGGEEIRQESSWRYPLAIFVVILVLSAVFLYYYVGPSVDELGGNVPSPAVSEESVELTVNGRPFSIPANYTVFPRDRRGGERENVTLYAMWPTMSGFAPSRRQDFMENADDTRRLDIEIAKKSGYFTERDRIEKLFMPETVEQPEQITPYELLLYEFKEQRADVPSSGYSDTELYLGKSETSDVLAIICNKDREDIVSPDCWRQTETPDGLRITYRFKRPYLPEWKQIDAEVLAFVERLRADG
ncbi:MAG: hypothetical protein AAFR03_16215 [Pseudomonadota bacterium]